MFVLEKCSMERKLYILIPNVVQKLFSFYLSKFHFNKVEQYRLDCNFYFTIFK